MPNSAYLKGYAFERRVMICLQQLGYLVIRTGGSKSPFDLVALRNGVVYLIQCKVKKQYMSKKAWRDLDEPVSQSGAIPLLSYRDGAQNKWEIQFETESGRKISLE